MHGFYNLSSRVQVLEYSRVSNREGDHLLGWAGSDVHCLQDVPDWVESIFCNYRSIDLPLSGGEVTTVTVEVTIKVTINHRRSVRTINIIFHFHAGYSIGLHFSVSDKQLFNVWSGPRSYWCSYGIV